MARLIVVRLVLLPVQLIVIGCAIFVGLRLLPVNPAAQMAGQFATPADLRITAAHLGLDKSLGRQLWSFLTGILHGNFAQSWATGDSVSSDLAARFPVTLQLIVLGFLVTLVIAVPLGLVAARRPDSAIGRGISGYALFAGSQPDFWWGLVFILLFVVKLRWLPVPLGLVNPGTPYPTGPTKFILVDSLLAGQTGIFFSALYHLLLPVATLAFVQTGAILKIMTESAAEIYQSDFVLYLRASGASRRRLRRAVLRNCLPPVVTVTSIYFAYALGGAAVIETVFSLNGLGYYALQSTLQTDYPAIQGSVLLLSGFALVTYLALDTVHVALDPRIRRG